MRRTATGMLKIVATERTSGTTTLRLEGQIMGPWVDEAKIASDAALNAGTLSLDLADVSFVDRRGVELLRALDGRGVALINPTSFVRELLRAEAQP